MIANIKRVVVLVVLFCICEGVAPAQTSTDVSTSRDRAVASFPDLADANSQLNQEFWRRYDVYKEYAPAYFTNPDSPMRLARESQTACQAQIQREKQIEREKPLADKSRKLPKIEAAPINRVAITGSMDIESHFVIKSSSDTSYIVKLINVKGGRVATIYVVGGRRTKVSISEGTYILRYAAGVDLFDSFHRFGPEATYGEATTYLSVRRTGGYGIGSAITLDKGSSGSLPKQAIKASDF